MRILRLMGMMGLLALPVLGQSTTSTVIFSVNTASGNPQPRSLNLEAVVDPDDDGSNIFWGWGPGANTVPLTNGVAAVPLEPNDYVVTLAGAPGSFTISVATNGMTYNAVDITTNLPGYLSASAGPATVIFPLLTMTGSAQTRSLSLTPIINPVKNGTNIVWGPALTATPTNGLATTHLEPNGYNVTMNGGRGSMTIYVPTDGGSYNAATLPSTMPSAPTLTAPPAPTLYLTNSFHLIQVSNGNGDVGGNIRLYHFIGYIFVDFGPPAVTNYVGITNLVGVGPTAWASPFDWSTNVFGNSWPVFTTEVGNGTNYSGESAPSAWIFYSHQAP